jgi:pyroglutamyl-peptidase
VTKILVTGFGPFPGQPRNATAEIVEGLDVPAVELRAIVLPVAWNVAPEIALREARAFGAALIVMCGVAGPRGPLKVECGATTHTAQKEDVDGAIVPELPGASIRTTLDVRAAVRAARRAIRDRATIFGDVLTGARLAPIRETNSYVCNHLTHRVLASGVAPSGFLHWPSELSAEQVPAARQVLARIIQSQLPRSPG